MQHQGNDWTGLRPTAIGPTQIDNVILWPGISDSVIAYLGRKKLRAIK